MKNLKKLIAVALIFCLELTSVTSIAFADEPSVITVFVDGVQIEFDVDPITESDRTLVPMRAIFEALGAEVTWDDATWTATAVRGGDVMNVTIDSNILYKNGTAVELDVPARMVGDRTLVPVRAISESFDALVEWNEEAQQVIITTEWLSATELSDTDFETLKQQAGVIRYAYEQSFMPGYIYDNSDVIYNMLRSDEEGFNKMAKYAWDLAVTSRIIVIQDESEDTYASDSSFLEKIFEGPDQDVEALYGDIFERAGVRFEDYIENITFDKDPDSDAYIAVIGFKTADQFVDCKYLAVVADSINAPRYFTAENDLFQTEYWFFCEVTDEARGTIGLFDKDDDAFDNFVDIAFSYYYYQENGEGYTQS